MRLKYSKLTFLCVLCLSLALFAAPVLADGTLVETEQELLDALATQDNPIVVSGDIPLSGPLVLSYDLTLTGTGERPSLRVDADTNVDGDYSSQKMIEVSSATVTMTELSFGMENPSPENDAYFWSLISVTASGDLTLQNCNFDGQGENYLNLGSSSAGYDREALNGVYVEDGTLAVSECEFDDLDMAGILLSSGARNITIAGNLFDDVSVGIMTLHKTAEDYNSPDSAIKKIAVIENDFGDCGFGVVLLPNVEETIIGGNEFGFEISGETEYDTEYFYPEIAGTMVLPVGIADFPGLMKAIDNFGSLGSREALDEMDPEFQTIHDLITTHLVFPEDASQAQKVALFENLFRGSIIGSALVGCNDNIYVAANGFENQICGTLETGFPGAFLGKLLDLIIDYDVLSFSSTSTIEAQAGTSALQAAVVRHEFPDYDANVTYFGNRYGDYEEGGAWVGAAVALNASATFATPEELQDVPEASKYLSASERRWGNAFMGNYCGILLANGPGDVTIRGGEFERNEVAIADVGYQTLLNGVLQYFMMGVQSAQEQNPLDELGDIFTEFEENSASTLLIEGNWFDLGEDEGIWLLNNRVSAVIRQNTFNKFLGYSFLFDRGMGSTELAAQDSMPFFDFGGSTAIRVGLSELDCVPARVSIAENDFNFQDDEPYLSGVSVTMEPELAIPSSFVHFDLVDASRGEFDLHLNRFDDLEYIYGNPNAYAVVVLGEDEIDGTRNLWLQDLEGIRPVMDEDRSQALTWQQAYQHVYGPLEVAPVLTDEVLDMDEDISLEIESDDRLVYEGTTSGIDFDVDVASGDEGSLVLKPVTEEEARSAFTEEELEDIANTFFLPLDIRVVDEVQGPWTFRFENIEGFTNEDLVVMTTTPRGVITWDSENAYVSEDGQWIVLTVGYDTTPSFDDFRGSVTVTGSSTGSSSGSGGGCQVGFAPVSALLLLLPLVSLKRR